MNSASIPFAAATTVCDGRTTITTTTCMAVAEIITMLFAMPTVLAAVARTIVVINEMTHMSCVTIANMAAATMIKQRAPPLV